MQQGAGRQHDFHPVYLQVCTFGIEELIQYIHINMELI